MRNKCANVSLMEKKKRYQQCKRGSAKIRERKRKRRRRQRKEEEERDERVKAKASWKEAGKAEEKMSYCALPEIEGGRREREK